MATKGCSPSAASHVGSVHLALSAQCITAPSHVTRVPEAAAAHRRTAHPSMCRCRRQCWGTHPRTSSPPCASRGAQSAATASTMAVSIWQPAMGRQVRRRVWKAYCTLSRHQGCLAAQPGSKTSQTQQMARLAGREGRRAHHVKEARNEAVRQAVGQELSQPAAGQQYQSAPIELCTAGTHTLVNNFSAARYWTCRTLLPKATQAGDAGGPSSSQHKGRTKTVLSRSSRSQVAACAAHATRGKCRPGPAAKA